MTDMIYVCARVVNISRHMHATNFLSETGEDCDLRFPLMSHLIKLFSS